MEKNIPNSAELRRGWAVCANERCVMMNTVLRPLRMVIAGLVGALAAGFWEPGIADELLTPSQIMTIMQVKLKKSVNADQILRYRAAVTRLDSDKDGNLSREEYAKNPHFKNNPAGTRGFFFGADRDRDGVMTSDEYVWQRIITDEAKNIYFALDEDRDRRVTHDEFIRNSVVRDKSIANIIFRGLDTNSNNELILPEYLRVWVGWAHAGGDLGSLD